MNAYDVALLAGRILFGGFFVLAGIQHFRNARPMAEYAAGKHVPLPLLAILATGLALVAGGTSVVLGILPQVGLALIILFLVGVTPIMHGFWAVADPQQRAAEQSNFLRNAALLGAALALLAAGTQWSLSVAPGL